MLDTLLIQFIPEFKSYWHQDDINREEDGSFTEHGVMSSFLEFYQQNYKNVNILQLSTLCIEFEKIVASDPNDNDLAANAICTMFLELLVDTPEGDKIKRYLGKECKLYWSHWES